MIYIYGNNKVVEACDDSGIVSELKSADYSLPKLKLLYKKRVMTRLNTDMSPLDTMTISDSDFLDILLEEGEIRRGHRVFVYGTLRDGMGNDVLLGDYKEMREGDLTLSPFSMYTDELLIPFVVKGNGSIVVESYIVDDYTLDVLDKLESNGYVYERTLVSSSDKMKNGYIYMFMYDTTGMTKIENGDFKEYMKNI